MLVDVDESLSRKSQRRKGAQGVHAYGEDGPTQTWGRIAFEMLLFLVLGASGW